jgi:hypothetical protein
VRPLLLLPQTQVAPDKFFEALVRAFHRLALLKRVSGLGDISHRLVGDASPPVCNVLFKVHGKT